MHPLRAVHSLDSRRPVGGAGAEADDRKALLRPGPLGALRSFLEGTRFLLRDERALLLFLWPGILSGVTFTLLFGLAARGFDPAQTLLFGRGTYDAGWTESRVVPVLWSGFTASYFAFSLLALGSIASVVSRPLLDRLGSYADASARGRALPPDPGPPPDRWRSAGLHFRSSARTIGLALGASPLALVPVLGPVLYLGFAALLAGDALLAGATRRLGLPDEDRRALVRANPLAAAGFGGATLLVSAIPIVGAFLAIPSACAGAPFLLARLRPGLAEGRDL